MAEALTYEKVWALFQEVAEEQKETARQLKELSQEAERRNQEAERRSREADKRSRELDVRIDKITKNLGGLGNSLGELIETLIAARLWEKFAAYPYNLQRAYRRVPIFDETNRAITDIDILLSNTEWVMAVEVKREPGLNDIDHHIIRMERIRKYPPAEVKGKQLLGAMAGGAVNPDVQNYAYKAGFFILELQGESVALVPPPEGFTPKVW